MNPKSDHKPILEELKKKLSSRVKGIRRLADRLECRLDVLKATIAKASQVQESIEEIDSDDDFGAELEELSIVTKARIMSLIDALKTASDTIPSVSASVAPTRARLPKLALPKFSGKYSEFKGFITLFETLVHNDESIPVIEKFNHLLKTGL
ncbi:uncharacterized protein LOC121404672 [Drosophila obscura]|uniref:uncharacterized protein LOC121404672 n=1 Tax=Drosophila obscura TaxID=7282 RepID=UPI001BB1274C|nr:uncharacterized protein LOC121404672 [Drosophila obscura]